MRLPPSNIHIQFEGQSVPEAAQLQPVLFSGDGKKKTTVRFRRGNSSWSDRVVLTRGGCVRAVVPAQPPYSPMEAIYAVSTKPLPEPFGRTQLVVVTPFYLFVNKTRFDLRVRQRGGVKPGGPEARAADAERALLPRRQQSLPCAAPPPLLLPPQR